jgi:hypothetical protein
MFKINGKIVNIAIIIKVGNNKDSGFQAGVLLSTIDSERPSTLLSDCFLIANFVSHGNFVAILDQKLFLKFIFNPFFS